MSNYEYSSYSSSTNSAGFDVAKAMFAQADANQDGTIDREEFQKWASSVTGGAGQFAASAGGAGNTFEASSYETSGYASADAVGGAYSADAGLAGASSFESSSYGATMEAGTVGESNFQSSSSSFEAAAEGGSFDASANSQAAGYTAETNAAWSQYGAEVRGAGLYVDTNPQIIRREAVGGIQTYTQNIKVRFLQPPPIPAPGPLIIKEVRPPQLPPPPPLRIKQQAPPLPQPAPLILRERPPQPPASQGAQTVIRKLPALPVPPRSVIIERIPAAPPRPRDIIIERWIPYGAAAKRKTIVQRAPAAQEYTKPRNVIIQYEPVQVRIVRQFQRLGVTQEDPQSYLQRYGAQLLDAQTLVQQARSAGVVEDISPPAGAATVNLNSSTSSQDVAYSGGDAQGVEFAGAEFSGASATFTSSSFESAQNAGNAGAFASGNFESGFAEGSGGGYSASSYETGSYSANAGGDAGGYGADAGFAGGAAGSYSSTSYESTGYTSAGPGFDLVSAAFNSADANKDGVVDANEFKQFYQGGL